MSTANGVHVEWIVRFGLKRGPTDASGARDARQRRLVLTLTDRTQIAVPLLPYWRRSFGGDRYASSRRDVRKLGCGQVLPEPREHAHGGWRESYTGRPRQHQLAWGPRSHWLEGGWPGLAGRPTSADLGQPRAGPGSARTLPGWASIPGPAISPRRRSGATALTRRLLESDESRLYGRFFHDPACAFSRITGDAVLLATAFAQGVAIVPKLEITTTDELRTAGARPGGVVPLCRRVALGAVTEMERDDREAKPVIERATTRHVSILSFVERHLAWRQRPSAAPWVNGV